MKNTVSAIALLFGAAVAEPVAAKELNLCSAKPFDSWVSVAYQGQHHEGLVSSGWYKFGPGECRTFDGIRGDSFYYHAKSSDPAAQYVYDQSKVTISGFNRFCYEPSNKFNYHARAKCPNRAGFRHVKLLRSEKQHFVMKAKNHDHLDVYTARFANRALNGRIMFERTLHKNAGREAPFSLGVSFNKSGQNLKIEYIYPGMPAEEEGLLVGDTIVSLDGHSVSTKSQLSRVLDNVSMFRARPLSIAILRDGERLNGKISPMFFAFNHKEYRKGGGVGAFAWEFADGLPFGFGNEVGCGALESGLELLSSVINDEEYNWNRVSNRTSSCSKHLNHEHEKKRMLYEDASNAGFWASVIGPGIPAAKAFKGGKAVRLAQRSRHVAPATYGKGSLK